MKLQDAHAIAVLTEWDEFMNYDWLGYDSMQKPAFILMVRAVLNGTKAIGFVYQTI
jgi:UDPglucose 6-dehydrogenase